MTGSDILQIGSGVILGAFVFAITIIFVVVAPQILKHNDNWNEDKADIVSCVGSLAIIIVIGMLVFLAGYRLATLAYVLTIIIVSLGAYAKESFEKKNKKEIA